MSRSAVVFAMLLLVGLLAGCVDDQVAPSDDGRNAADAAPTASTGAVTGQVITVDLEIAPNVAVGLVNQSGLVALTDTDTQGRYTLNGVVPGGYRIQLTDPCCRTAMRQVTVLAGQTATENFQLERLTQADLRTPHMVERQWDGLVACSVSVLSQSDETCGIVDANRDEEHRFQVREGLVELVVGMDWEPVGTSLMPDLRLRVWHPGGYSTHATYGVLTGPPPLVAHIRDEAGTNPVGRFDLINETLDIEFRVYSGNNNAVYQQPFSIYWSEFYYAAAPEVFDPLPDG